MNKLLSCVLSFALLSNCATPLAAQTPRKGGAPALKNIDLSNTNKPKMDPAIEANIKKAAQEAAALSADAEKIVLELEQALTDHDEQKAEQLLRQLAELTKQQNALYFSMNTQEQKQALLNYANQYSGPGGEAQDPLSVYYQDRELNDAYVDAAYAHQLKRVVGTAELEKMDKEGTLQPGDLVHFIRPLGQGTIYRPTSAATVAAAAQMLSGTIDQFSQLNNADFTKAFLENNFFEADRPEHLYRTDLAYIQSTLLTKLHELLSKSEITAEDAQAIGSLRIALLKILDLYFDNHVPNPIYFDFAPLSNEAKGQFVKGQQRSQEEKDKSQHALKENMYQSFKRELLAYKEKNIKQTDASFAAATTLSTWAVLYTLLYNDAKLAEIIQTMDKGDSKKPLYGLEADSSKYEQNFTPIVEAMLATVVEYYAQRRAGTELLSQLKHIVAYPGEKSYSGYFYSLPTRIFALQTASRLLEPFKEDYYQSQMSSSAKLPDWLHAFKPTEADKTFFAYHAAQIYCPLVKPGNKPYGLSDATRVDALADKMAWIITNIYSIKTTVSAPGQAPRPFPFDMPCNFQTHANYNAQTHQEDQAKQVAWLGGEALLWIYGGEIFSALGTGYRFLRGGLAAMPRAFRAGATAYKEGRAVRTLVAANRVEGTAAASLERTALAAETNSARTASTAATGARTANTAARTANTTATGARTASTAAAGARTANTTARTASTAAEGTGTAARAAQLGSEIPTAQAAARTAGGAGRSISSFSEGQVSKWRNAWDAFVTTIGDAAKGSNAVKGFLRRNAAEMYFLSYENGQPVYTLVRNNKTWKAMIEKAQKVFVRQQGLDGEAIWFELSAVPKNYGEMGQLWKALKTTSDGGAAGFRLYTTAQYRAIEEAVKLKAKLSKKIVEKGGVDVYVPLEDGSYWNLSWGEPPVPVVEIADTELVYMLPKGTVIRTAAPQSARLVVRSELQAAKALEVSVGELRTKIIGNAIDKAYEFTVNGQGAVVLTPTAAVPVVEAATVANLAVQPQLVFAQETSRLLGGGIKHFFTQAGKNAAGFAAMPLPQARVAGAFVSELAPAWVPQSMKPFYAYLSRFGTSRFSQNFLFFSILEAMDHMGPINNGFNNMMGSFAKADVDKEMKNLPHLQQALEDQKTNPAPQPSAIEQDVVANAPSSGEGSAIGIPLIAAWRAISKTKDFAGIRTAKWLDFNLLSDAQKAQFKLQDSQLAAKPIMENYARNLNITITNKMMDQQRDEFLARTDIQMLISANPSLKKELKTAFNTYKGTLDKILQDTTLTEEQKSVKISQEQKRFGKIIGELQLNAEEKTYLEREDVKTDASLKAQIKKLFDAYRKDEASIVDNTSLSDAAMQDKLLKRRTKLYADLDDLFVNSQEAGYLSAPDIQQLAEAVPSIKKDISRLFNAYRKTTQAIRDNAQLSQQAKEQKVQAAQKTLGTDLNNLIQNAQLSAFKSRQDIKEYIEVDPSFEQKIDRVFGDYFAKINQISANTRLSAAQQKKQAEDITEEFSSKIENLLLNEEINLQLTRNPDLQVLRAAYPDIEKEVRSAFETYHNAMKQILPEQTGEAQVASDQLAFTVQYSIAGKFLERKSQDPTFWQKAAAGMSAATWKEYHANCMSVLRQQILIAYPSVADSPTQLAKLDKKLEEFLNIRVSLKGKPNLDKALEEQEQGELYSVMEFLKSIGSYK